MIGNKPILRFLIPEDLVALQLQEEPPIQDILAAQESMKIMQMGGAGLDTDGDGIITVHWYNYESLAVIILNEMGPPGEEIEREPPSIDTRKTIHGSWGSVAHANTIIIEWQCTIR